MGLSIGRAGLRLWLLHGEGNTIYGGHFARWGHCGLLLNRKRVLRIRSRFQAGYAAEPAHASHASSTFDVVIVLDFFVDADHVTQDQATEVGQLSGFLFGIFKRLPTRFT